MAGATCKSACCTDTQSQVEEPPAPCNKEGPDLATDSCSMETAGSCCAPKSGNEATEVRGGGCCLGEAGKNCSPASASNTTAKETETGCCASESVLLNDDFGDGCCEAPKPAAKCTGTSGSKTDDPDQCPDPCCKGEDVKDDAASGTPACCEGKPSPCCNGEPK